jgi:hypothetical protein
MTRFLTRLAAQALDTPPSLRLRRASRHEARSRLGPGTHLAKVNYRDSDVPLQDRQSRSIARAQTLSHPTAPVDDHIDSAASTQDTTNMPGPSFPMAGGEISPAPARSRESGDIRPIRPARTGPDMTKPSTHDHIDSAANTQDITPNMPRPNLPMAESVISPPPARSGERGDVRPIRPARTGPEMMKPSSPPRSLVDQKADKNEPERNAPEHPPASAPDRLQPAMDTARAPGEREHTRATPNRPSPTLSPNRETPRQDTATKLADDPRSQDYSAGTPREPPAARRSHTSEGVVHGSTRQQHRTPQPEVTERSSPMAVESPATPPSVAKQSTTKLEPTLGMQPYTAPPLRRQPGATNAGIAASPAEPAPPKRLDEPAFLAEIGESSPSDSSSIPIESVTEVEPISPHRSPPQQPSRRRVRNSAPPPALPGPITLVEQHLVPVLVERSLIASAESVDVISRTATLPRPPAPGHAQVVVDDVRLDPRSPPVEQATIVSAPSDDPVNGQHPQDFGPATAMPAVHLHIGRIEVTRTPRTAQAGPSRSAPPTVDHSEYLTKRRDQP